MWANYHGLAPRAEIKEHERKEESGKSRKFWLQSYQPVENQWKQNGRDDTQKHSIEDDFRQKVSPDTEISSFALMDEKSALADELIHAA